MSDFLSNDDLLMRYLDGELPTEERTVLEERIRTNKSLKEKLVKMQTAVQAVRHLGTMQQVASIHAEMMEELKPAPTKVFTLRRKIGYVMAVAASLLALFVGGQLYLASQQSSEKIYNNVFVDFNLSATRGTGTTGSQIENDYREKDYKAVTSEMRSINMDAEDSLLVGLAFLHTTRTPQAISIFERLASSVNDYQQDAEFYLSLSYLKNKNYNGTLKLFEKINSNSLHLYHDRVNGDVIKAVQELNKR
jgi:tetratricopeptide (TPR) repeat protein